MSFVEQVEEDALAVGGLSEGMGGRIPNGLHRVPGELLQRIEGVGGAESTEGGGCAGTHLGVFGHDPGLKRTRWVSAGFCGSEGLCVGPIETSGRLGKAEQQRSECWEVQRTHTGTRGDKGGGAPPQKPVERGNGATGPAARPSGGPAGKVPAYRIGDGDGPARAPAPLARRAQADYGPGPCSRPVAPRKEPLARRDAARTAPARKPDPLSEVASLVDAARSRGAMKSLGQRVDQDAVLRSQLVALARRRGAEVAEDWPGKKLVRVARAREAESRVRTNPIRRDQSFVCLHCGKEVTAGGGHVRDHCPFCLRSRHVDHTPGDRAADCGGLYDPVSLERSHGEVVIGYRCRKCGKSWRGRAHADDRIPADFDLSALPGSAAPAAQTVLGPLQKRARTLPLRVLESIRRQGLWAPGDRVVVAVSGGLDSTVLLEILAELQQGHGGRLEVASINHGLRPESVMEVARVGRRAEALGLPFHPITLSVASGPGLSERARSARWEALASLGADRIATAHHLDDQAETVLQRLLRGSGARGLRSMQPRAGVRVRPLLAEPRAVLHRWAEDRGLSWEEDPSNPATERGRIRALFPQLESLRAGAASGLARSARLIARDDDLLDTLARAEFARLGGGEGLSVAGWRTLHPALQLRVVLRLVATMPHGAGVRADQLERLLGHELPGGARFELGSGWAVVVRSGRLSVSAPDPVHPSGEPST